jgi:uncharacterized protein YdhG (YjbR/CyaY superfamily)
MSSSAKQSGGFSDAEKAAMRERAREAKMEERLLKDRAAGEKELLSRIASMPEPDRSAATKIHAIVSDVAPHLMPRTWYGMPAYANAEGKVICFFKDAAKFKERYMTFGFNPEAKLDEGNMWPNAYALTKLTEAEEKKIAALVKKAVGGKN